MNALEIPILRAALPPLALLACCGILSLAGCADRDPTTALAPDGPAYDQVAAGPVVTILTDSEDDGCDVGECTLREAIAYADAGAVITFAPGLTGTIPLAPTQLVIDKDLEIAGPGAGVLAVSGQDATRVFEIAGGTTVTMSGLTIRDGHATNGAGLHNLGTTVLSGVIVTDNAADGLGGYTAGGGGISNGGDLTLENCAVTDNWAYHASTVVNGGGISSGSGTLTLIGSTVARNTARAGIVNGAGLAAAGAVVLINSTIADNLIDAVNGAYGTGVYLFPSSAAATATLSITNSTVSGNKAYGPRAYGGGIYLHSLSGGATVANTLVAGNTLTTLQGASGPDVWAGASLFTATHSLIGSADGNSVANGVDGNIVGVAAADLLIGVLADNGGPTETVALLPGSPAIDAGTATGCPATDQRGVARPQGDDCDIGAFEARAYAFNGFFAPVGNLPVLNEVKAGRAVPLKFSLDGDQGPAVLAAGYPTSEPFACDGGSATSEVTETATAGQSGLSYDALTDSYTYVWKTDKSWANSCRRLTLRLSDEAATTTIAEFRFVK